MGRRATTALAAAALIAAVVTPVAASYVNHQTPASKTVMVERLAPHVPVTSDAALLIRTETGLGTGFYVGGGKIVTAAHVVNGFKTVSIKATDGRISMATIIAADDSADVAILKTDMRLLPAEIDCGQANVGDAVMAIGNPMGQEFVSSFGRIAGAPRVVGERSMYVTDVATVMGMSGGPVFRDGLVIGVTSAVMLAPLELPNVAGQYVPTLVGFGYVVPSAVVCKMLADLPAEGEGV